MKNTSLWIFSIFLATSNGMRCYFKNYGDCVDNWGDEENLYKCLKNLTSIPKECTNDEICSTVALTLPNGLIFAQRGCANPSSVCGRTNDTVTRLEELGEFVINEIKCGSCDSDLCNVTNFVKQNYGTICFFTDMANCFQRLPQNFTPEAQNKRFECLTNEKHFRCGVEQMCYSKTYKFTDNSVLILKGCSNRVSPVCPSSGNKKPYHYYIGKDLNEESDCEYCEGSLCNNKTSLQNHKKLLCLMTPYKDCLAVPQNNESVTLLQRLEDVKLIQNKTLACLKNSDTKEILQKCEDACGALFVATRDKKDQLAFRDCGEDIKELEKNISEVMESAIGRKDVSSSLLTCATEDRCNRITITLRTGLLCYQSSLMSCLENLTLIIPTERMFECVKKMNRQKNTTECQSGEKCTTISMHLESDKPINFLTCGTGPKELCESMINKINIEKYIGKKVVKTECNYCESHLCNNITEEEDASEKTIQCYFSDFDLCTKKLSNKTKPTPTSDLKKIQEEIYECFRAKPNKTRSCRRCLTVTFIFYEDKVLQAAFCDSIARRFDPCYIPHMERPYFKKYTGLTLIDTRCRRCLTPLCNNFVVSSNQKSEVVAITSLATYQMYNFSLILILIYFEFILLSKFCSETLFN